MNFSGVLVPFVLYPDELKSVEIIGRKILRDKLSNKKSFTFDDGVILGNSQEYFAKANLLRELRIEQAIIDNEILCGNVKNFYIPESVKKMCIRDRYLTKLSSHRPHQSMRV